MLPIFFFVKKRKRKKGVEEEKEEGEVSRKIQRQDPHVSKLFGLMVHTYVLRVGQIKDLKRIK